MIGAGAAGLMAAGVAAERGKEVILIEKNDKPARKVMITGKGRCNVTNNVSDTREFISNIPGNGRFLYGAFSLFSSQDTIDFFESYGVSLKTERGNRVFPVSDKVVAKHYCVRKRKLLRGRHALNFQKLLYLKPRYNF